MLTNAAWFFQLVKLRHFESASMCVRSTGQPKYAVGVGVFFGGHDVAADWFGEDLHVAMFVDRYKVQHFFVGL